MTGGFRSKALIYVYFSTATLLLYGDTNTIPSFREEEETVRSAAKPSREDKWAGKRGERNIGMVYTRIDAAVYLCKQRIGHDRCGFVTVECRNEAENWPTFRHGQHLPPSTEVRFVFVLWITWYYLNGVIFANENVSSSFENQYRRSWKTKHEQTRLIPCNFESG